MWACPFCLTTRPRHERPRATRNVWPRWTHVCIQQAPRFWATTHSRPGQPSERNLCTSTRTHEIWPHSCTNRGCSQASIQAPIHIHAAPRKPTNCPRNLGCPTNCWPPTFRATTFVHRPPQFTATIVHGLLWAPTKFWTAITLYGRPRKILGLGQPHTSTKSLGAHAIIWTPTKFYGQPRNRVDTK